MRRVGISVGRGPAPPDASCVSNERSADTMSMGELPNFLIIGAAKAGTTSLYHYLRSHPQVFMPPVKELDFFVAEGNWRRGLDWYRKQFESASSRVIAIGEASTRYTIFPSLPGVPGRIAKNLPDARFIYVVRDPIERIRSHYQHRVAAGTERAPLQQAVFENPRYLNCSRYATQIEQYLQFFPRERLLLITSEQLRHSRPSTICQVYKFLGIESDFVPETLNREFYKSEDRIRHSPAGAWLRHTLKRHFPASKRAKEIVDSAFPGILNQFLRGPDKESGSSAIVSEALRSELSDGLRDEVRRLHAYMPEEFDGWGIA
jgi:hypothetical protein